MCNLYSGIGLIPYGKHRAKRQIAQMEGHYQNITPESD
nr:MAG TPA: hypothetical protein [Caudoviricetes sp.]